MVANFSRPLLAGALGVFSVFAFDGLSQAGFAGAEEHEVTVESYTLEDTNLSGDAILTITGATASGDEPIMFDLEGFAALPQTSFETSTIWTDENHTYSGVLLSDLVEIVGATGDTIVATAINDYAVEIPLTDAVADGPIIASQVDGENMSVRDKGPLWLIYPFDSSVDYQSEVFYARSIWQLNKIAFK